MPFFVSVREIKRLEREASFARKRADEAERRLEEERKARDTLNLAVLDHVATKDKGYAISARLPKPLEPEAVETEAQILERLKTEFEPTWRYYLQVALDASKSESDAEDWMWRKFVTHEPLPFEQTM